MKILIDMKKLAQAQKMKKGMTLQGAYGHEQQHVQSNIAIINSNTGDGSILANSEEQAYDTPKEALAAAEVDLAAAEAQIDKEMKDESDHKGPNSPRAGKPYDPIGEMPGDPANKGKAPIKE